MSDQVMMRFEDGPLCGVGNVRSLAGTSDFMVPADQYGWPLPERLKVLAHLDHSANVAIWDPEREPDRPDPLPVEITGSPNAVTYRKVSESQIPDEAIRTMEHVVRGAVYKLEETL